MFLHELGTPGYRVDSIPNRMLITGWQSCVSVPDLWDLGRDILYRQFTGDDLDEEQDLIGDQEGVRREVEEWYIDIDISMKLMSILMLTLILMM